MRRESSSVTHSGENSAMGPRSTARRVLGEETVVHTAHNSPTQNSNAWKCLPFTAQAELSISLHTVRMNCEHMKPERIPKQFCSVSICVEGAV